jgi:hypothetical protein
MINWGEVKKLHNDGYSNKQIKDELKISFGSIQRILKNIAEGKTRSVTNNSEPIHKRLKITEYEYVQLLKKLYWQDQLSQHKIANKLHACTTTIENNFTKYNIGVRSTSESSMWEQKTCNLTDLQIETLDGMMLGDGCLVRSTVSSRITYGCKFKETLLDIQKEFNQLHFSNPWGSKISDKSWRTKNRYWHMKSSYYNDLLPQQKRWYKNIKTIPDDIRLTPKSFYWWFIGDGYTHHKCIILCTDNFENNDLIKLQSKLNNLNYKTFIGNRKRLRFDHNSSSKFISDIENNNTIAQEYQYKFDKFHEGKTK